MFDGFLSLVSTLNPTTNFQFGCYIFLIGFIAFIFREPLVILAKRKKGCYDADKEDKFAPISFMSETERRLSSVEVIAENNSLKLGNLTLGQELDRKDIAQTKKDLEKIDIKLDLHFSQSKEVMMNLTSSFEANTRFQEDKEKKREHQDEFMEKIIDIIKKGT